jgi:death-on-curing protein
MPPRIYPTVAETIETHRLLIEQFGGLGGIRDMGLLESAVLRAQNGYYSDLIEEGSALMESLANNHAFIDGNSLIAARLGGAGARTEFELCSGRVQIHP